MNLDPERLMDILADTSGAPTMMKARAPTVRRCSRARTRRYVRLAGCMKDLQSMQAEGKARRLSLPLVQMTLACMEKSASKGLGGKEAAMHSVIGRRNDWVWGYRTSASMREIMSVTLAQASTIVDVALKKGRETNCAPLTVAVLDAGGHLVAFKREDRSGILRFDIAFGKAWGALGMGFGSRELAERATKNPVFISVLTTISGGRLVPVPGGVLIRTRQAACSARSGFQATPRTRTRCAPSPASRRRG